MVEPEKTIVAIPAKNEEDRIGACLDALARQTFPPSGVVLLLNNCTDGTFDVCQRFQPQICNLRIAQHHLKPEVASAGEARRLALDIAASLAEDGILFTTDADGVVPPDWIEANLREFAKGAEVVCGTAQVDPVEALLVTPEMHRDYLDECACFELVDEIDSIVAPDPVDPWPRHQQRSGASIAMRTSAYRRAGGAPPISSGEDRALVERLRLVDARIRHAFGINVIVSGRLEGRAAGGMAEAMKRRLQQRDEFTDERLEPATDAYRRSLAKAASSAAWRGAADGEALARDLLIAPTDMARALGMPYFGAAWSEIEALSPVLRPRRRVSYDDLPRETRQARLLRDQLLVKAISAASA